MEQISILITEDHTLIREAWATIFNSDPRFKVVAETGNAEEAIELSKQLKPDIVIMDINLPGMNGMEAIPLIRKFSPGSKVLGVSLHTQPTYARKMMQEGAMGYVTKNSTKEEMFKGVMEVHSNHKFICEEIKTILSAQLIDGDNSKSGLNALSRREIEVIYLIKKGESSKEIAAALNISVKTIEVHRYNILKKLGLKNAAALVNFIHTSELALSN
jgi:DNA-binding NarL/FixJ family response regulator